MTDMSVGIDALSFYSARYFIDMKTLAAARGVDPEKYYFGLGQYQMAVPPPDEDVISMGASACWPLLRRYGKGDFDFVIFTTESGVDQSKAGAVTIRGLLELSRECRVVELKQACYSSTAGLQLALSYVETRPTRKVLLVASDIARYGLMTPGEPTQGCGALAIVVSAHPRLLEVEPASGYVTDDVMDFWRPNYSREAFVDGKYSTKLYLSALTEAWDLYVKKSGRTFRDHARFCYHLPFTRMAEKAHLRLAAHCGQPTEDEDDLLAQTKNSLEYNRRTGNSYTASLYVGLTSLLDNSPEDLSGKRVGFFSYGSGCSAEYFSGIVQPGYREALFREDHAALLRSRIELDYEKYREFYNFLLPTNGSSFEIPKYKTGPFRLAGIHQHKRIYKAAI